MVIAVWSQVKDASSQQNCSSWAQQTTAAIPQKTRNRIASHQLSFSGAGPAVSYEQFDLVNSDQVVHHVVALLTPGSSTREHF
jgi:phage-related baseplate assembly protein